MLCDHYYPDVYEMQRIIEIMRQREEKKMKMSMEIVIMMLKGLYPIVRPILKNAIDNPDVMWDDYLMDMFDRAFGNLPENKE